MRRYRSDLAFQIINTTLIIVVSFIMVAPMIHVLSVSLSDRLYADAKLVGLWPRGLNLNVYERIARYTLLWRSMAVTVWITLAGTAVCLALSSTLAYSLSRPNMRGSRGVSIGVLFTFIFSAPLIPTYLVVRGLGLENRLLSLILPNATGAFYVFIMRTFFRGISGEIYDAAQIDGASEIRIYLMIVLPLSQAVLATIALFHAVGQWNAYFNALIYIRSINLQPLQMVLRQLIREDQAAQRLTNVESGFSARTIATPEQMKAGVIFVTTLPILLVYPFLQKYFVKGAMLGSIKG